MADEQHIDVTFSAGDVSGVTDYAIYTGGPSTADEAPMERWRERIRTDERVLDEIRDRDIASAADLARALHDLQVVKDQERRHMLADDLLLRVIGDAAVNTAFDELDKWYA